MARIKSTLNCKQGWAKCSKTQRLGRFKRKDSLKIYLANKDMLIFNRWNSEVVLWNYNIHKKTV